MDSFTQIVLGAAVGEAVLGRRIGNKALLYGAIGGTIPDLDILSSFFTDTVSAIEIHRGITHSLLFSLLFSPVLAWIVTRYEAYKNIWKWTQLFFWSLITHSLLDAHTSWGTQILWPWPHTFAFKTIFVIDPLYTVPFTVCLIFVIREKKESSKRKFYNWLGLGISTVYLLSTFILKAKALIEFENALQEQDISYFNIETRPSPMNTILWNANIETEDAYLLANYSFFDSQPIHFAEHYKNHQLLGTLIHNKNVKRMIAISEGWYTIEEKNGSLYFNDLRFGVLGIDLNSENFVFQYKIDKDAHDEVFFEEQPKSKRDGKKLMTDLWTRIWGN